LVNEGKGFEWWKEEKTRKTTRQPPTVDRSTRDVDRSTLDGSPSEERVWERKKGENWVISKMGAAMKRLIP
jgi:hypothetical protein